jgi:hypothetical protein
MTDDDQLERLPAESRAVLSLILARGRSVSHIAATLGLDEDAVRARAHHGVELLAETGAGPETPPVPRGETRARIIDYLLGEQSVSERARTRSRLARFDSQREWAHRLSDVLEPIAGVPLPAIPDPAEAPPEVPRLVLTGHPPARTQSGAKSAVACSPRSQRRRSPHSRSSRRW